MQGALQRSALDSDATECSQAATQYLQTLVSSLIKFSCKILLLCSCVFVCIAGGGVSKNSFQELILSFFTAGSQGKNSEQQAWLAGACATFPAQFPCL